MSIAQTAKNILGHTERIFGRKPVSSELLVICMHSTPTDRIADFKKIVDFLDQRYTYLQASEMEQFMTSHYKDGPYYTLTFDDGLKNNFQTAQWLASQGKKATYFVVPDFIESDDQANYYQTHIRPIIDRTIDHEKEDITAMSWADLRILQEQGHVIGAHSASHRLNNEMEEPAIHYELVDAKKRIEENLGISVNVFASPNNTLFSVNKKCAVLIKQHYSFHHITVPGSLADDRQSLMIYRRNIEVYWKKGAILYALGHWDLKRWRSAQSQIAALLR